MVLNTGYWDGGPLMSAVEKNKLACIMKELWGQFLESDISVEFFFSHASEFRKLRFFVFFLISLSWSHFMLQINLSTIGSSTRRYNTFSGYPPEIVKKMPKKDLAEEVITFFSMVN